ncbi:MazG nucleotide pyrophosphohydrolase domain-containing protein [Isoptericola sp. NPDC060257]|uniref:MazG nucleotide pyrophosphohydrolase domain-containing protein n=1 Tax=Isoptericola sp. NPDC060257 TaxID=3347087 RepID=UPI003651C59E
MTLDEICENVRFLSTAQGWAQDDPSARMLHLVSEVGEVADALRALQSAEAVDVEDARSALGLEIFDAIWNLCALANTTGVDLTEAATAKMRINAARTWPRNPSEAGASPSEG